MVDQTKARIEFDPENDVRPSTQLLQLVAYHLDQDPVKIEPPLSEVIDIERFDGLMQDAPDDLTLSFTYAGTEITIFSNGEVIIRSGENRTTSNDNLGKNGSEIDIKLGPSSTKGQFSKIQERLGMKEYERDLLEYIIHRFVEKTVEEEQLEMPDDIQHATANVIAATLYQEFIQRS